MLELQLHYERERLNACQSEDNKSLVKEILIDTIKREICLLERKIQDESSISKKSCQSTHTNRLVRYAKETCHRYGLFCNRSDHPISRISSKIKIQT